MAVMSNISRDKNGSLKIGSKYVRELAEKYGTPLYIIDEDEVRKNCRIYKNGLERYAPKGSMAAYASKAFCCKHIYEVLQQEGLGADVVSGGEIFTAASAGFDMQKVYFHGNNKSECEINLAIKYNVGKFVADNIQELYTLDRKAGEAGKQLEILLRIKPGVEAHTHDFIRTGQIDSKFGLALENGEAEKACELAVSMPNLNLVGLHCHIGSQIFDYEPFEEAASVMMKFIALVKQKYRADIKELNLGGGYGIKYLDKHNPVPYEDYIKSICETTAKAAAELGVESPVIIMEPGRSIVGNAGITVYKVGCVKRIEGVRTYVSVDGGMGDNPRYILYEAEYEAALVDLPHDRPEEKITIAGKCCESGDILLRDFSMPVPEADELIAVLCTGAYNYSMASNYNRIPRAAVAAVSGNSDKLIVHRESLEDIVKNDL